MRVVTLPNGMTVTVGTRTWLLFWLSSGYTITLYPNIYTTNATFNDPEGNMDVLMHESVHLNQQASSPFGFYLKYVFSRSFRYKAEFEAYLYQLKYYLDAGIRVNMPSQIEVIANMLSSANYLWCVSKDQAVKDLTEAIVAYGGPDCLN